MHDVVPLAGLAAYERSGSERMDVLWDSPHVQRLRCRPGGMYVTVGLALIVSCVVVGLDTSGDEPQVGNTVSLVQGQPHGHLGLVAADVQLVVAFGVHEQSAADSADRLRHDVYATRSDNTASDARLAELTPQGVGRQINRSGHETSLLVASVCLLAYYTI